jgi:hypothetical protein
METIRKNERKKFPLFFQVFLEKYQANASIINHKNI